MWPHTRNLFSSLLLSWSRSAQAYAFAAPKYAIISISSPHALAVLDLGWQMPWLSKCHGALSLTLSPSVFGHALSAPCVVGLTYRLCVSVDGGIHQAGGE
jgi:hypothetical protein